jgi:hypothetical protein
MQRERERESARARERERVLGALLQREMGSIRNAPNTWRLHDSDTELAPRHQPLPLQIDSLSRYR